MNLFDEISSWPSVHARHAAAPLLREREQYLASFGECPAGFYDLFVSAMAFTPTAAKVRVKQGQRMTFNANLRVDPLVSKELVHRTVNSLYYSPCDAAS
jgi:hypothetical protein